MNRYDTIEFDDQQLAERITNQYENEPIQSNEGPQAPQSFF